MNFKLLIFIDEKISSGVYVRRCLEALAESQALKNNRIFQQDNARPHVGPEARRWFRSHQVELLPNWPPRSPDLSPIEDVWSIIQGEVDRRAPLNVEDVKKFWMQEWERIPMSVVNKLVRSFQERLRRCVEFGGKALTHATKKKRARRGIRPKTKFLPKKPFKNAKKTKNSARKPLKSKDKKAAQTALNCVEMMPVDHFRCKPRRTCSPDNNTSKGVEEISSEGNRARARHKVGSDASATESTAGGHNTRSMELTSTFRATCATAANGADKRNPSPPSLIGSATNATAAAGTATTCSQHCFVEGLQSLRRAAGARVVPPHRKTGGVPQQEVLEVGILPQRQQPTRLDCRLAEGTSRKGVHRSRVAAAGPQQGEVAERLEPPARERHTVGFGCEGDGDTLGFVEVEASRHRRDAQLRKRTTHSVPRPHKSEVVEEGDPEQPRGKVRLLGNKQLREGIGKGHGSPCCPPREDQSRSPPKRRQDGCP